MPNAIHDYRGFGAIEVQKVRVVSNDPSGVKAGQICWAVARRSMYHNPKQNSDAHDYIVVFDKQDLSVPVEHIMLDETRANFVFGSKLEFIDYRCMMEVKNEVR